MWRCKVELEVDILEAVAILLALWVVAVIALSFEMPLRGGTTSPDVPPAG